MTVTTICRRGVNAARRPSTWLPKGLAWAGLIALGWLAVALEFMLLVTYPWQTLAVDAVIVAFIAGWVMCLMLRGLQLEPVQARKDTAIDAAFDTAFELQRVSGEHPQVEMYQQTDAETLPDVPDLEVCGLCGLDPAEGLAYIAVMRYCHGPTVDDEGLTCYERVSWERLEARRATFETRLA